MTYVLSDIHGHMRRFENILAQIGLKPDDTLYILGDVIDRHPLGIPIIKKIMKMPNAHMLLGNHEYMMLEALGTPYEGKHYIPYTDDLVAQWYDNGGGVTHMAWFLTPQKEKDEITAFLKSLPLNIDTEAGGRKFKLVHAAPRELYGSCDKFGKSPALFCVWDRKAAFTEYEHDYTLIFGHTPTVYYQDKNPLEIWKSDRLIDIDCGCGYDSSPYEHRGRLGCLRLEDMKEFYAE